MRPTNINVVYILTVICHLIRTAAFSLLKKREEKKEEPQRRRKRRKKERKKESGRGARAPERERERERRRERRRDGERREKREMEKTVLRSTSLGAAAATSRSVRNRNALGVNTNTRGNRSTNNRLERLRVSAAGGVDGQVKWVGNRRKLDLNKAYYPLGEDVDAQKKVWYVVDAEGKTLGRLATMVSMYLRGKHLPTYSPSMDTGGYVVVINCDKVAVTGRKETDKVYYYHRVHRPGTMKTETFSELRDRIPERIVERAVKGMLPKGRLGNKLFTHLKCYGGSEHPHEAQKPVDITSLIDKKPKDADLAAVRQAVGLE